jgi:hypothetical protein
MPLPSARKCLLVLSLFTTGCEPDRGRCLVSRTETIYVPESCHNDPFQIGDVTIFIENCDPPHTYQHERCDKWEFPNGHAERDDPHAGQ